MNFNNWRWQDRIALQRAIHTIEGLDCLAINGCVVVGWRYGVAVYTTSIGQPCDE